MWHHQSVEEIERQLVTNLHTGLTQAEAERRILQYGPNMLLESEGKSIFELILDQFKDLMVVILLVAAAVSTIIALTDQEEGFVAFVEPIVILLILIANAVVGVWQESNAEAALKALKDMQPEIAKVLREGRVHSIASQNLVPGDIVELVVGDTVPADIRIAQLKTPTFRVSQASLTGENKDISKIPTIIEHAEVLQDKINIAFSSSLVAAGHCFGIVIETGMNTEIGKISQQVKEAEEQESKTPLQEKLEEFGELLAWIILIICGLVWIMNWNNFYDEIHGSPIRGAIYYFKIAIALAVAAVPEGLPAVITTCLALGTRRMAKRNAIVRKLPSVETLGCTTIICSDKTGTLTTNEMTIEEFLVPDTTRDSQKHFLVSGHSFKPEGEIQNFDESTLHSIQKFVQCATYANDSVLEYNDRKGFTIKGAPTEASLRVLVEKMGHYKYNFSSNEQPEYYSNILRQNQERLVTLEFTRERKSMSVLCKEPGEQFNTLYAKGAPESILERCNRIQLSTGKVESFTESERQIYLNKTKELSSKALRCLALAYCDDSPELKDYSGPEHPSHTLLTEYDNFERLESNLIFLGIVGMRDPPRPEVADAIATCRMAGIRVFMITGDNKLTAEAIARDIHILDAGDTEGKSFTGREWESMQNQDPSKIFEGQSGRIFSRTEPKHKRQLVQILQGLGEVVAMTGDGVNDAPALQEAKIGIAMGIAGTEVAKQASDMILADDNFSTIVAAVEEGRSIYNNTKAFIRYLISSNIGEVASIFLTAMLGLPENFTSVQLLWVNLVTDGPPATALGFNPPDPDIMKKPPRRSDDNLITPWVFFRYMVIGIYVGFATVGIFVYWYTTFEGEDGHPLVSFSKLSNWSECPGWSDFSLQSDFLGLDLVNNPCLYFTAGKIKASTLSLSVLVTIEMLNALNALSEDCSLLQVPPWVNPWLILAICGSMSLHMVILYVPALANIFGIVPLTFTEWMLILAFSSPVIFIDEILKFIGRRITDRRIRSIKKV